MEPPATCRPPVFILVTDGKRIPVWPAPPKVMKGDLPIFCPKEHRATIVEKFRIHLHQHPQIPFNDENKTCLTSQEIYRGAAKDMYDFCFQHDLGQVWAYLWNRWYTPKQWKLWARSTDPAISKLKTTMIVESLWRNLKHRDLQEFNRPRLDLVTHIIISDVLPRVRMTLDYIQNLRRIGRPKALAGWQTDFRADWVDMSHSDEYRLVEKELKWLKAPKKTKGRNERLAEIAEEESRPRGEYLTEIDRWTCSCPAYLISRFLLCKHLVRKANEVLDNAPITSLTFFANLRRQCYPPYYSIEGIHFDKATEEEHEEGPIRVLGRDLMRSESSESNRHSSSSPDADDLNTEIEEENSSTTAEVDTGEDREVQNTEGAQGPAPQGSVQDDSSESSEVEDESEERVSVFGHLFLLRTEL